MCVLGEKEASIICISYNFYMVYKVSFTHWYLIRVKKNLLLLPWYVFY
jgi:hypothetical protein